MQTIHIVVVDDEEISLMGITLMIEKSQLPVTVDATFTNSVEAVEYISNNQVDILLTDLNMPELSGINLIELVKEKSPVTQIIVLTGFGSLDYATEAMKNGVKYFLTKPSSPRKINETIALAIEDYKSVNRQELLRKKQIVENIIFDEDYSEKINQKFSFLTFSSQISAELKRKIESSIQTLEIPYVASLLENMIFFYFFNHPTFPISEINKEQFNNSEKVVFVFGDNQDATSIESSIKRALCLDKKSFYTQKEIWLSIDNEEFKNNNDAVLEYQQMRNILRKRLDENNFSFVTDSVVEFIQLADNALVPEPDLKLDIMSLFEASFVKFDSSKDYFDKFRDQIQKSDSSLQISDCINNALAWMRHENDDVLPDDSISNNLNFIIEKYFGNSELSLKWISQHVLFLNVDYLGKTYLKETGTKFSTKLTEVRMIQARKLLVEGKKVSDVAELVGLGNTPNYFGQLFKKYYGYTPKQVHQKNN